MNLELLKKVRQQIEDHPELHSQFSYGVRTPCGTTHCIAGWALSLSGVDLKWTEEGYLDWVERDGVSTHPGEVARELLGLTREEGDTLFLALDSEFALRNLDDAIEAAERGEQWITPI